MVVDHCGRGAGFPCWGNADSLYAVNLKSIPAKTGSNWLPVFYDLKLNEHRKRPLNPMPTFNFGRISSGVVAILQSGSLYASATFSAHYLNRHTDPVHW